MKQLVDVRLTDELLVRGLASRFWLMKHLFHEAETGIPLGLSGGKSGLQLLTQGIKALGIHQPAPAPSRFWVGET